MMADVLIVGGYGVVGSPIAAHLDPLYPGRVVTAGRDERKAQAACDAIGAGTLADAPAKLQIRTRCKLGMARPTLVTSGLSTAEFSAGAAENPAQEPDSSLTR